MIRFLSSLGGGNVLVASPARSPFAVLGRCIKSTSATPSPEPEHSDPDSYHIPFALYKQLEQRKDRRFDDLLAAKDRHLADLNVEWRKERAEAAAEVERLKSEALRSMEEKLRLQHNFNVRGGLERITYKASLDNIILTQERGVQKKLDAIAALPSFRSIIGNEVATRKLVPNDVEQCQQRLYHEVSKHAHGNDGTITLREKDYAANEYAALVTYFKLQDQWTDAMVWREEKAGK